MEGKEKSTERNESKMEQKLKDQLLNFAEFCSFTWGRLPSEADLKARFNAKKYPDVSIAELEIYLESSEMIASLIGVGFTENHLVRLYLNRGTDPANLPLNPVFEDNLTREQLDALSSVSDIADPRPLGRKLKELGISSQVFSTWLYDETFYRAFINRLKKTVEGARLLAMNSLAIKAANGDNLSISQLGAILENVRVPHQLEAKPITRQAVPQANYRGIDLPDGPSLKTNEALTEQVRAEF